MYYLKMAIIILFIIAPVFKHLKVDVDYKNEQKVMYFYNGILYYNENKNYSYMQQHVLIS